MQIFFEDLDSYQKLIAELPTALSRKSQQVADRQGQKLVQTLRDETIKLGAVGSTKKYLHGHKVSHFIPIGFSAGVKVWNDSPHAKWVERGRDKNQPLVPEGPLREWMRSKGIPQEAFWAIRKAISKRGTIKRANHDGLRIYEKTVKREERGFLIALSDVLESLI